MNNTMIYYATRDNKVFFASQYFDVIEMFVENATDIILEEIAKQYHWDINNPVDYDKIKSKSKMEDENFSIYQISLQYLLNNQQVQLPNNIYINSNDILEELYND